MTQTTQNKQSCSTCGCTLYWEECRTCGGTGEVEEDDPINGSYWYTCQSCGGGGECLECPNCDSDDWV